MTAQQIMERLFALTSLSEPLEKTCDMLIAGNPNCEVSGIATTFMATVDVIRQAYALGCNLIITHEPTYFNGWDKTEWLENDPVYAAKTQLIDRLGITIWRCHDYMHLMRPDPIYTGLLKELGWEGYTHKAEPAEALKLLPKDGLAQFFTDFADYYDIPEITLDHLARYFKEKTQMETVRIVGDAQMSCRRVGILVGGGSLGFDEEDMPARLMRYYDIDVMVCGEITEWTLCAYVNDAAMLGQRKGMIILGHERSEEWGMKHLAEWLPAHAPAIPVHFLDAKEPFQYL